MNEGLKIFLNGVEQKQGTFVDAGYVDYRAGVIDFTTLRPAGDPISFLYKTKQHPTEDFVEALDAADRADEGGGSNQED